MFAFATHLDDSTQGDGTAEKQSRNFHHDGTPTN